VCFLVEAEVDQPWLDGLVESRQFRVPVPDAQPDDADVVERREHAEAAELGTEGVDARRLDRPFEGRDDVVRSVRVRLPEELQRDVCLLGVGAIQARHARKQVLYRRHLLGQPVEVDADEQPLAHRYPFAGRPLESTAGRPSAGAFPRARPVDVALNPVPDQSGSMTERERDDHEFSSGQGLPDSYEEFDLDPPELAVDPDKVDPVDARVVTDMLDDRNLASEEVDAEQLLDVALNYMQIHRFEQAADAFERTARFAEDEGIEQEAWVNKGVAHAEIEEYDLAIGAYREALDIDDSSEYAATAETNLAYALWEAGRSEQALEHAERAVELDERFARAWYNRGFFLLERGLAEDALNSFDNAIRLGHRSVDILEEKARALEELGKHDRAEEVAQEAEERRQQAEEELVSE